MRRERRPRSMGGGGRARQKRRFCSAFRAAEHLVRASPRFSRICLSPARGAQAFCSSANCYGGLLPTSQQPRAGQIQACLGRLVGLVGSGAREDQAELLVRVRSHDPKTRGAIRAACHSSIQKSLAAAIAPTLKDLRRRQPTRWSKPKSDMRASDTATAQERATCLSLLKSFVSHEIRRG